MGIYQLKLVNGEEIICSTIDETKQHVVAQGILALRSIEDWESDTGETVYGTYALFPWMTYQTDLNQACIINKSNIIGMFIPGPQVQEYYTITLKLLQDVVDKAFAVLTDKIKNASKDSDQVIGNIVRFPGGPTKH
jgi:hypothetical protein